MTLTFTAPQRAWKGGGKQFPLTCCHHGVVERHANEVGLPLETPRQQISALHSCLMLHLFSEKSAKCVFWRFLPIRVHDFTVTNTCLPLPQGFSAPSRLLFDLSFCLWHSIRHGEPRWHYRFELQTYTVNNTKTEIAFGKTKKGK